jgi:hypothetical protein
MITIIPLYILASMIEHSYHRFIMHTKPNCITKYIYGSAHQIHHDDVNHNMTLRPNYDKGGLFFEWDAIIFFILIYYIVIFVIGKKVCNVQISNINLIIVSIFVSVLYRFGWNYYHKRIHFIDEYSKCLKNPYFNWVFKNHSYHHLQKGKRKGNFNILLPGFDYMVGTNNTCIDNKKYCKKNYNNLSDENKKLCDMELNNKKLQHGLLFC